MCEFYFTRFGDEAAPAIVRMRPAPLYLALTLPLAVFGCGAADDEAPADGTGSSGAAGETSGGSPTNTATSAETPFNDSSGEDTGEPSAQDTDDESSDTGETVGTPVFVAVGDGGWFANSCDAGRTWSTQAFSDDVKDHSPWSAFGGLAAGNGALVAGFGWGPPGTLMRSTDGANWDTLPNDAFVGQRRTGYDSWTAAVLFDGQQFLTFANRRWASTDGTTWSQVEATFPAGVDQLRQGRAFADGQIVLAVESQSGRGHPVGNFIIASEDGGSTWTEGRGYDPQCGMGIQHFGDIAQSGDTLVVASDAMCRSTDRGLNWEAVPVPDIAEFSDVLADADGFAFVSQRDLWRSSDGAVWSLSGTISPDQDIAEVGYADGTYAAVQANGAHFFYSDDGTTWAEGTVMSDTDIVPHVRDLAVLHVDGACSL